MPITDATTPARPVATIVVIDDHQLLASAIEAAVDGDDRLRVVAVAGSLGDGVDLAARLGPDLVVSDRRLPDGDVEDHLEDLRAASPRSKVLVMTGWPTERALVAALAAGAHGVVTKDQPLPEVVRAAHRVLAGETVVPEWLLPALLDGIDQRGRDRTRLTSREIDVLELLADGRSTTEAARHLCISVNTLRNHLSSAMAKLGETSRVGAIASAMRSGLVAPPVPDTNRGKPRRQASA